MELNCLNFTSKCDLAWCSFILIFILGGAASLSLEEDLRLTQKQYLILNEFRSSVESQITHDYMKKDIYLVRWLRARNFDVNLARNMLFENLEWREKNSMDTIDQEDWSDYEKRYKFWIDGVDKEGRPISFINLGSWDFRRAVISGERARMMRYIDRYIELGINKVWQYQQEGRNVTQVNLIVNLAGYSATQNGCLQCIPFYISFVSTYELRYPGMGHKIYLVNTPSVFEVVLRAVRPMMSTMTRDGLIVLGTNRRQYEPILFNEIEKDQLPLDVGGTDEGKIYNDFDDINGFTNY